MSENMLGNNEEFKIGQRVRPSPYGIELNIFCGTYRGKKRSEWSGMVVSVDEFNSPTVKWDAIKTPKSYAPWFIASDSRRRAKNSKSHP